jgi:hypothetical protein
MPVARLLSIALVLALLVLPGCGGDAADPAAPAAAAAAVPTPSPHPEAGWAAPVRPLAGAWTEPFASGAALKRWGYVEGDYGRNRFRVHGGRLEVVPPKSSWVNAHRAFYLYRGVRGDFDVRTRLRVTGRDGPDPHADWSLSGLLVRAGGAQGTPENWIALRAGRVGGRRVFERKTTERSQSQLALLGGRAGWTQLRIVRRGERFTLLTRPDGGAWKRRTTYARPDLPATLQVGIDAFSGLGSARADLRSEVDWIRFAA